MKQEPVVPTLEFVCRGYVHLAEVIKAGELTYGERRIVPFTGGHFEGKIAGKVLPGGADTQWVRPDGTAVVDASYMIGTDDGAVVYLHNHGLRAIPLDVVDRISRGEEVDPTSYYFRTTPEFTSGSPKYAWVNDFIGVCSGIRVGNSVILDFYKVL
jgi:hypothetical protein